MSEWTELAKAVWADDKAKTMELVSNGADLEHIVERMDYDCEQAATALGWAVKSWCSPELVAALVEAGARMDSKIVVDGNQETLLEYVRHKKKPYTEGKDRADMAAFQKEFWGRAPTKDWFASVERILTQAAAGGGAGGAAAK